MEGQQNRTRNVTAIVAKKRVVIGNDLAVGQIGIRRQMSFQKATAPTYNDISWALVVNAVPVVQG